MVATSAQRVDDPRGPKPSTGWTGFAQDFQDKNRRRFLVHPVPLPVNPVQVWMPWSVAQYSHSLTARSYGADAIQPPPTAPPSSSTYPKVLRGAARRESHRPHPFFGFARLSCRRFLGGQHGGTNLRRSAASGARTPDGAQAAAKPQPGHFLGPSPSANLVGHGKGDPLGFRSGGCLHGLPTATALPASGNTVRRALPSEIVMSLKSVLFGRARSLGDQNLFHKVSLIALFAWVGLGAERRPVSSTVPACSPAWRSTGGSPRASRA